MIEGMLELLVQSLHLGAEAPVLSQVLSPLGRPPLRVLAINGHLARPLRAAGYEVYEEGQEPAAAGADLPDVLCASLLGKDLIRTLEGWGGMVRKGGMVLTVTRRGRPKRSTLCAAFLHAGLLDPAQRSAGMAVLTAGRVG
jgi:hypothetical protein